MTQAVHASAPPSRAADARVVGGICAAHFVSHYYILLLPPLFVFVRAEYGVSYTQLALALTAFNVVSAVLQTPAGFLVDRLGARIILIGGLVLGAAAFAVAGLVHSYWVLVAMFAVAGVGNTVYHPADYAVLSDHVSPQRIGQAFSYHTFSGMLGTAVAPASLLFLQSQIGWRGAFLAAAAMGLLVALLLAWQGAPRARRAADKGKPGAAEATTVGWRLLMSPPILLNLIFFVLLSIMGAGFANFSIVALGALYGTELAVANTALSAHLLLLALGVLAGGVLLGRTSRYGLVSTIGLSVMAAMSVAIGLYDFGAAALMLLMSVGGFFLGTTMPSRDMIVRSVTPPGAFGKVFGFVTTGFNIGGIIGPLMFGLLMDYGNPRAIFMVVAGCAVLSIATVLIGSGQRTRAAAEMKAA